MRILGLLDPTEKNMGKRPLKSNLVPIFCLSLKISDIQFWKFVFDTDDSILITPPSLVFFLDSKVGGN